MKRLLQMMLCVGFCTTAMAIPAKPGFVSYVQPDGEVISVRIVGDEHGHITYSEDGLVLVAVGDRLEYASFDACGMPVASGVAVTARKLDREAAMRLQTSEQINSWSEKMQAARESRLMMQSAASGKSGILKGWRGSESPSDEGEGDESNGTDADGGVVPENFGRCESSFPVLGEQKGLVVLVEYQDIAFDYGDYDYFHRMLNEEGFSDYGSLGSARDWFIENSDGKFVPEFDVFGPVQLPYKRSYYGGNDVYGNDKRPEMMAIHALDSLDSKVDFSQYDRDGDGKIDNVFIFYAGKGEHDSNVANAVWPHSWDVSVAQPDTTFVFDGVVLDHYACTCEYPSGYKRPDGIGTFVHEFSHVMGLPDLYVTSGGNAFTPGPWSVLDYGPYNNDRLTPPNYSSVEKCALGWIDLDSIAEGKIEIPNLSETNNAYVLPTERENEYYFFENRQQRGNDAYLPYHGMLVWRVDYNEGIWASNSVNNTSSHQRVDIIEADNKKTASSRDGDPFPGAAGVTELTFETKPQLASWNGEPLAYDIKNIEETEEGLILFDAVRRDSTGDNAVGSIEYDCASGVCFDLLGRRVSNPAGGIYIRDGKKVVVKGR